MISSYHGNLFWSAKSWAFQLGASCCLVMGTIALAGNEGPEKVAKQKFTLEEVLALAMKNNAEIKGAALEESEAGARLSQTSIIPNPSLDLDIEKVKNPENRSTTDFTVALSQTIELGGKRGSRQTAAEIEVSLSALSFASKKLDFTSELIKQYVEARTSQEKSALMQQRLDLARQTLETVSRRFRLGKGSSLDEAKARAILASTELDFERIQSALKAAQEKLAFAAGIQIGIQMDLQAVPDSVVLGSNIAELEARIADSLLVKKLRKEAELKQSLVEVERSKQYPDLTVKGGVKYTSETKEKGFVAGISLPFPLFDRNQGNLAEASFAAQRSIQEQLAGETLLRSSLKEAFAAASTACKERVLLQRDVIPLAMKASGLAEDAFRSGRLDYLEVLDAQKGFFDAQGQLIESSETCFKASADIWRIVGRENEQGK